MNLSPDNETTSEVPVASMREDSTTVKETESKSSISALQDNIERKGKNAYYFAHARKANGPEWDGKVEPRLLSREASNNDDSNYHRRQLRSLSSFDHTSNITSYAFTNEGEDKIKIYIDLPNVEVEYPNEEDVQLVFTKQSFELSFWRPCDQESDANGPISSKICDKKLAFSKLFAPIENASMKRKNGKIVLTLIKSENSEWSSIGAK